MNNLYPIKFDPVFKDKIWGGDKIKSILNKEYSPLPNCGETWEISSVEGNVSVVANGSLKGTDLRKLIREYRGELVGQNVYKIFGDEFPLLIKFIDANDDLSIQVHPDDILAKKRHGSFGKTEMWYILQADEGSSLISGFNREMDKELYLESFNKGELTRVLNKESAKERDIFFIPAGRVHTIGKGLLLAEIQQTSDVTYRIFDFDRKDEKGNQRDLHVEEALEAIDYHYYGQYKTPYKPEENKAVNVVTCDYFQTNVISLNKEIHRDYHALDSFIILIATGGSTAIHYKGGSENITKGEVVLLPASLKEVTLIPKGTARLLETFVPLKP